MAIPDIVKVGETLPYPKLVFERPINPIAQPKLGLIGGNLGQLKSLSQTYETSLALGNWPTLYLPNELAGSIAGIAHELSIQTFDPTDRSQSQELFGELSTSHSLAIAGIGLPLSSNIQIRLEELFTNASLPILVVEQTLRLFETNRPLLKHSNLVLCCDNIELLQLINHLGIGVKTSPERGIYQITDLIYAIHEQYPSLRMLIFEPNALLMFDPFAQTQFGLMTTTKNLLDWRGVVYGVMASMLAYPAQQLDNFMPCCLNGGYIIRQILDQTNEKSLAITTKQIYTKLLG